MYHTSDSITKFLTYLGITLIALLLFFLQVSVLEKEILSSVLIFLITFFFISEILGLKQGLYFSIIILLLQLYQTSSIYYTLAALQIILVGYYLLLKKLRNKKIENLLAREKHFRKLVNLTLQPIILKNEKGEVLFASDSLKNLLSLKRNLKVGETLLNKIHPEDIKIYCDFIEKLREVDKGKGYVEYRFNSDGRGWIWIRNEAINLLNHDDVNAIVSSIQDITLQKELDKRKLEIFTKEQEARTLAEKAVRDRDEFLSIASHELKTPLTTVLLQLQATLRKISTQSLADFSGAELMKSLKIAEKQSQSLSTLIKDLLNVSLASSERLTLNKEVLNISELISSLISRFDEEIRISGSDVSVKIKEKEIVGEFDPVRIEQAITNLFTNALKYGSAKKIIVTVKKLDNIAVIKFKDNGEGIPKELQGEIFKPFRRVNKNANIHGLGVGLFITKQIVENHGGEITLKSKPGKGSTFTVKLPLKPLSS